MGHYKVLGRKLKPTLFSIVNDEHKKWKKRVWMFSSFFFNLSEGFIAVLVSLILKSFEKSFENPV